MTATPAKGRSPSTTDEVISRLRSLGDPVAVAGMARYGINPRNALGISVAGLRALAREIGPDHQLAEELWASGIQEARILGALVAVPSQMTEERIERWASDFDSWNVCDTCCNALFAKTSHAHRKAVEWSTRPEEFVKRAGFTLMATLAVHDKKAKDEEFKQFLALVVQGATDERNFVKKAVNWALRQIGKRNAYLNGQAIETARQIQRLDSRAARWIAADAIRELTDDGLRERLERKRG